MAKETEEKEKPDEKKAKGAKEMLKPSLEPIESRFPTLARILASADLLSAEALLKKWKEEAFHVDEYREADGEVNLPVAEFEINDIAHELKLPYHVDRQADAWRNEEGQEVLFDDVADAGRESLRGKMSEMRKYLNDHYGFDLDIEVEGRGGYEDPYAIVFRYNDAEANPILEKIN